MHQAGNSRLAPDRRAIGRRVAIGAALATLLGIFLIPQLARRRVQRAREGTTPWPPADGVTTMLSTVAAFMGSCFGHHLTEEEIGEVVASLKIVVEIDPQLARLLPVIQSHVDWAARRHGANTFASASPATREKVVAGIMGRPVDSRQSALRALVSDREMERRLIRWNAMDRLAHVYAGSPPSWQRRGYVQWPGRPLDPRAYTRPEVVVSC